MVKCDFRFFFLVFLICGFDSLIVNFNDVYSFVSASCYPDPGGGTYKEFAPLVSVGEPFNLLAILPASVLKYGIKRYDDPIGSRNLIREENNGKVGVYCWLNNVNGKFYIGSGDPLYLRISNYYQPSYYLARPNLYILRALSKYGMSNFSLIILEYTNSEDLISCEQK
jgi:hypothetical protein